MPLEPTAKVVRQIQSPTDADRRSSRWAGNALDEEQMRALAMGAFLTNRNGVYHDTLEFIPGHPDDTANRREVSIDILWNSWSVDGRDSAMRTVRRLHSGMHAPYYGAAHPLVEELIACPVNDRDSVRERHLRFLTALAAAEGRPAGMYTSYYRSWEQARRMGVCAAVRGVFPADIYAWDLARTVLIVRAGFTAGYLTHDDAWPLLLLGLELARARYPNWRQFGRATAVGRYFWSAHGDLPTAKSVGDAALIEMRRLASHPLSPWRRFELHPGAPVLAPTSRHDLADWV